MENTLYFKDMIHCDQNNYPKKVYKVEYSKMLIEILDSDHIHAEHTKNSELFGVRDFFVSDLTNPNSREIVRY